MSEVHAGPGPGGPAQSEVTRLLVEYRSGDREAFDRLFSIVYDDLRRIARRQLRSEREGHTLNTTALVHESYLSLVDQNAAAWRDRAHFFALASRVMRHLLVDRARRRSARKRGGGVAPVPLTPELVGAEARAEEILALDEALQNLGRQDERMARIVECRFFGGMTGDEVAEAIGVSTRTVEREWRRAKAHLYSMLRPAANG